MFTRIALRAPVTRIARPAFTGEPRPCNKLTAAVRFASGGAHAHETESFEAFNTRYRNFFDSCDDLFELQRGLNNCFAYDLVPTTEVVDSALRCARKVNDYATAVRILEGVREKVENKGQYKAYLEELKGTIEELGTSLLPTRLTFRHL
jgi:cytochrome c oxidase subunit 5a